jgi:hypothetical protein
MSNKLNQVSLNTTELKSFLKTIIHNNQTLQTNNKPSIAVEVIGESGIGKTSSVLQLADELSMNFVKLNLAQIEELGDLVGFPIRQFQMAKNKGTAEKPVWSSKWADEHLIESYRESGWKATGKSQMAYCAPEWIANKKEGGILVLDDWNRADVRFIQAVMELIDRQEYISWKLPKNWHIILTANPDTGDYLVQSIDSAQKTRFISANLKFNVDDWAIWAESAGIDGRCINFLLMHPELVTQETNARSITTFFNAISGFEDFTKDLIMIQMIGEGSVGPEFATMFTQFIHNKLDKIISPLMMLTHESDQYVISQCKQCIGEDDDYRADIASVLCTRLANYSLHYAQNNSITQKIIDRIMLLSTEDIFANDLKYYAIREIINGNKNKFKALMLKPEVLEMVTK